MFVGIDVATERHCLVRLDEAGRQLGQPTPISEDRAGYARGL